VNPLQQEHDEEIAKNRPTFNKLDSSVLAGFSTGRPLADKPNIKQCKHCKRPVLEHIAARHIKDCLKQKQEKTQRKKKAKDAKDAAARQQRANEAGQGNDDDASQGGKAGKGALKSADADGEKKGKKRKAETEADKAPTKKKKKDEPKSKVPKPKAPVDVEKQCGVPLPNGGQCARSLTCKSHSMGMKRAVPGRSLPYDVLLANYQKKNQAKQQRKLMISSTFLRMILCGHTVFTSTDCGEYNKKDQGHIVATLPISDSQIYFTNSIDIYFTSATLKL
jgi:SAGA-associated factor 73